MADFIGTVITEKGLDLLQRAQYGDFPLTFVKVAAGDGEYTNTGEDLVAELKGLTELKSKKQECANLDVDAMDQYTVRVRTVMTNREMAEGYHVRELGLYAKDPEQDDAPVLYAVTVLSDPEKNDYWAGYNGKFESMHTVMLYVVVSDSASVTIYDNLSIYLTIEDFEAHLEDYRAHVEKGEAFMANEMTTEDVDRIYDGVYETVFGG